MRRLVRLARRRPALVLGLALVLVYVLMALLGPQLTPYGPTQTDPRATYQPPSAEHPFGTDKFGRDVLTRVVYATRLDLAIAASVALSAFLLGSLIGGLAGYRGGWLDDTVMRVVDVMFAFPAFILAMAYHGMGRPGVAAAALAAARARQARFSDAPDRPFPDLLWKLAQLRREAEATLGHVTTDDTIELGAIGSPTSEHFFHEDNNFLSPAACSSCPSS